MSPLTVPGLFWSLGTTSGVILFAVVDRYYLRRDKHGVWTLKEYTDHAGVIDAANEGVIQEHQPVDVWGEGPFGRRIRIETPPTPIRVNASALNASEKNRAARIGAAVLDAHSEALVAAARMGGSR